MPVYPLSYIDKLVRVLHIIQGKKKLPVEVFTPMEEGKFSTVEDIDRIWHERFEIVMNIRQNAFAGLPATMLQGSDSFRYTAARALIALDRLFCRLGITKGFDRKMIARKRV